MITFNCQLKNMNKPAIFFFAFGLLVIFLVHNTWAIEKSPRSISGPELMQLIKSDQAPMIIDVRSPREYKSGHISKWKKKKLPLIK